jgi:hypothetical protein
MSSEDQITTKRHRISHLELFDVSGEELDNLEEIGQSVGTDLQFFTFWIPIGLSATFTLNAITISDIHVYNFYLIAAWVGFGMGIYHGIRWLNNRGRFKKRINKIRERQIGPVGEEGKELKPSELENLPAGAPEVQK